jgi:hypothetical protein
VKSAEERVDVWSIAGLCDVSAGSEVRFEIPTKNQPPPAGFDRVEFAFANKFVELRSGEARDVRGFRDSKCYFVRQ